MNALGGRRRVADMIVDDLRAQIASGVLQHGARLPTERELAAHYGVSGSTVREALQGLSAMGLLDVRHGSGTYVTALADGLVAKALATVVQLEGVSLVDLIGLLGALSGHAARLSIERATDEDIRALEATIAELSAARDVEHIVRSVKDFVAGLAAGAHDALLLAIVRFLLDVQFSIALQSPGEGFEEWHGRIEALQPDRIAIVAALKRRDTEEYVARVKAFHAHTVELVSSAGLGKPAAAASAPPKGNVAKPS